MRSFNILNNLNNSNTFNTNINPKFNPKELIQLYKPLKDSHKGQNGKLMIIGGSHLFHGASLWALKVASRIVDMVFYSSVKENNEIAQKLKSELYDLIVVPREKINDYLQEAETILVGTGMLRSSKFKVQNSKLQFKIQNLQEIEDIEDEGEQAYFLTKYLLQKYPNKKWVIDAGALQMMTPEWLKQLNGNVIITPHHKEFETLFLRHSEFSSESRLVSLEMLKQVQHDNYEIVQKFAKEYNCIVLLKGVEDVICSPKECVKIQGGNFGMTKGGTGDVLAGIVAALACKNDLFLSAKAASFINKKAGEELYKRVGPYFNASDLADEIPKMMKELLYD